MNWPVTRSLLTRYVSCFLFGIALYGCGDPAISSRTDGGDGKTPVPIRLLFTSVPTRVEAGAVFDTPVRVALFREDGSVDPTWTGTVHLSLGVNATVAELDGSLSATAVAGVATFDGLSITHAATGYTLRAATDGYEIAESLAFTVTPAPATTVEFLTQPSSRTAGQVFDPPLEIELRDRFGNPVTNSAAPVTLALQQDGETPPDALLGTTSVTQIQGRALFADLTPVLAGKGLRLLASVDGGVSATSRRFDVAPDGPAQLAVAQQPGSITADDQFDPPIAVVVEDQFGNRTLSEPRSITLTLKNGLTGVALAGTTSATTTDGVATFPGVSVRTAGKGYLIDVQSGVLTGTVTTTFDVIAGVEAGLNFRSQPVNAVAGVPFNPPVVVAVVDAHGNIVETASNPITLVLYTQEYATPLTLNGTTTRLPIFGQAVFNDLNCTKASTSWAYYLVATTQLTPAGRGLMGSNNFRVSPADPFSLTFLSSPVSGTLRSHLTTEFSLVSPYGIRIRLTDMFGNIITDPTPVSVSLVSPVAGAQLLGTRSVTSANGIALFTDLLIDTLGHGYVLEFNTSGVPTLQSNPLDIVQLSANESLSAGPNHTCALTDDLAMYCWGSNAARGLSNSTAPTQLIPVATTVRGMWNTLVNASANVTCGMKPDGSLWCRGDNSGGIFGNGTFVSSGVHLQELTKSIWTSMAPGGSHACALKADASLWCWGSGAVGQRGDGASGLSVLATSTPAREQSNSSWLSVSAGLNHTCGIKTDGTLWCWGEGADGQLGNGSTSPSAVPVRESSNATWSSVRCGYSHTCGVRTDGTLWCWGLNDTGELGDGSRTSRSAPVQESSQSTWSMVSSGGSHTCGIRTDGTLWCWGAGAAGQLGDGKAQTDHLNPVQENSTSNWTVVVTGASHTCGLKPDRTIWCWGSNLSGQLGTNGASTSSPEREYTKSLWGP